MIKAVAIDDEMIALKVVENFCRETSVVQLDKIFADPMAGLKHLTKYPADLLFLDIDMPNLNGIELYKRIPQDIMVIFITSCRDYAAECFNLKAVDYLLKPYTFERFQQALKKADTLLKLKEYTAGKEKYLYLRSDLELHKIDISQIMYIEALDDYLKIHISNQKVRVVRMTMKAILEKLPAKKFIRTHKSFIVAMDWIEEVRYKTITLKDVEIPISYTFSKNVRDAFRSV